MYISRLLLKEIIVLMSVAFPSFGWAGTWGSNLQGGGHIEVDSTTNKATLYNQQGASVPLWDGVHRLEDGSTVIIRDGVMVPNEEVLELRDEWSREQRVASEQGQAVCTKLVRKVCGLGDECASSPACTLARQLREFAEEEERERARPGFSARFLELPGQCREGLDKEAYFKPCNKETSGGERTPCAQLVSKVCGVQGGCAKTDSCGMARSLLDREYEERLAAEDPHASVPGSEICEQALSQGGYFSACRD